MNTTKAKKRKQNERAYKCKCSKKTVPLTLFVSYLALAGRLKGRKHDEITPGPTGLVVEIKLRQV
jgi:hypothetical protein